MCVTKLLALALGEAEIPAREAVLVTSWVGVVLHLPGVVSSRAGQGHVFRGTQSKVSLFLTTSIIWKAWKEQFENV